jgi:hypothetical protein
MNFKFATSIIALKTKANKLTFDVEFSHPNDNLEMINLGLEYSFKGLVSLRAGRKINGWSRDKWEEYVINEQGKDPYVEYPVFDENGNFALDGFSVGGGLKFESIGLSVDYAYASYSFFGSIHRYTLCYEFKKFLL